MSDRNKCWQYYTTQNDRGPLYLNYILLINQQKTIQYRIVQYNVLQTSTCEGQIKNEIILLNLI